MPRRISKVSSVGVAALALAMLAGCAPEPAEPSPSGTASSSPSASPDVSSSPAASPTASADPAPSEIPDAPGTPLGVSCLDLVSLDTMYQFDPNFGLDDSYTPPAGSIGATAVAAGGIACGWVQQTSGEVLEIAAAQPAEDDLATLRSDAGTDDGGRVLATVDGRGVVQAFAGPHWVVATSTYFGSADDAALLIDSAFAALR